MPLLHSLSLQAQAMQFDWWLFIIAGWVVWLVVMALIAFAVIRWRARPGNESPPQFTKNLGWEITSVIIPLVMVTALFVFNQRSENVTDALAAAPDTTVEVTAFRWSWKFTYPGTGVTVYGTPQSPPILYLPVDRVSRIVLTSADVTHSFWVPALLYKRDAIPGVINRFDITPTRIGSYPSRCAQFCGLDHAFMTFTLRVVSQAGYDRYLASDGVKAP